MSNTPLSYEDTAREILEIVQLEHLPMSEVIDRVQWSVLQLLMEKDKLNFGAERHGMNSRIGRIIMASRTTVHMKISALRARYGQG